MNGFPKRLPSGTTFGWNTLHTLDPVACIHSCQMSPRAAAANRRTEGKAGIFCRTWMVGKYGKVEIGTKVFCFNCSHLCHIQVSQKNTHTHTHQLGHITPLKHITLFFIGPWPEGFFRPAGEARSLALERRVQQLIATGTRTSAGWAGFGWRVPSTRRSWRIWGAEEVMEIGSDV